MFPLTNIFKAVPAFLFHLLNTFCKRAIELKHFSAIITVASDEHFLVEIIIIKHLASYIPGHYPLIYHYRKLLYPISNCA